MQSNKQASTFRHTHKTMNLVWGLCLALSLVPSAAWADEVAAGILEDAPAPAASSEAADPLQESSSPDAAVEQGSEAGVPENQATAAATESSETLVTSDSAPENTQATAPQSNEGEDSTTEALEGQVPALDAQTPENEPLGSAVAEGATAEAPATAVDEQPQDHQADSNGQTPSDDDADDTAPAKPQVPANNCALESGLSYGLVFDLKGGKTANKTNVQLYRSNDTKAQRFRLEKHGDAYFIVNISSGKVLDVAGGKAKKGTNVWLYKKNGTKAQLWIPERLANGSWVLRSALNKNLVLDVAGGKTKNGTNLQIWTYNGSKAQTFWVREVNPDIGVGSRLLEEGAYQLSVSKDQAMSLEVAGSSTAKGANIQLGTGDKDNNQRFYATYADGYYTFQNVMSGLALEVASGSPVARANVRLWNPNHTNAQQWLVKSVGEGLYTLVNRGTGLVLEISGGKTANGTNIWGYYANGTASQVWKLERTSLVADGFYTLSDSATGKVLDVTSGSTADGAQLQRYKNNGTIAQKFYVQNAGDEVDDYAIRSANSASWLTAQDDAVVQSKNAAERLWHLAWNGKGIELTFNGSALEFGSDNKALLQAHAVQSASTAAATFMFKPASLFTVGCYQINGLVGTSLDVKGQSLSTAEAVTAKASSATSQVWRIWKDKGYYVITNLHSGLSLELGSISTNNGIKIWQGSYTGAKKQLWKIVWNDDTGGLRFVNVYSNKALTVKDSSTKVGATIEQRTENSATGQSWRLVSKGLEALKDRVAQVAEHFAKDDNHGYSQPNRGAGPKEIVTLTDGFKATISAWDVDCSELVRQCVNQLFSTANTIEYLDTRCEDKVLLANGFQRIKFSASAVQRGDVLWKSGHTAIALGGGKQAEAAVDEYNGITGPTRGDQTKKEVAINNLGSNWTYIYRYVG